MRPRIATPAALAMTMAFVAAGCSSGDGSGDSNSFEFWSFTGINQEAAVDEYLQDHPDAEVKLTEVGGSVETAQALTTALAGGKVPDLVLIQGDDLPKFVEQPQNFHDLREFGADDIQGDYLDWVISQSTASSGEILGIPTDVGGMAIAYRTDLFADAGLPTDREEVGELWPTWDAFIETGRTYTEATGEPFAFVTAWNDFLWPFIVPKSPDMYTVQIAIKALQNSRSIDLGLAMSGSFLATLPLLLLFIFVGRRMVAGILEGAFKG